MRKQQLWKNFVRPTDRAAPGMPGIKPWGQRQAGQRAAAAEASASQVRQAGAIAALMAIFACLGGR